MADVRWTLWVSFGCFLLIFMYIANGERTSQKIYTTLNANTTCFRRLNATHQIGCASARGGNVGIVHYVSNISDLEWLLDHGPYAPYIVIIHPTFFNRRNLTKMRESGKINGILVISAANSSPSDVGYSPDHACPNQQYGMYESCAVNWNSYGDGMFFEDWGFPIFLIQQPDDIENLIQNCYQKYNAPLDGKSRSWPLCASELYSVMYAARDTPTCIRRSNMFTNLNPLRVCDPLNEKNIWASLLPMNKSSIPANRSLIVVAARLDSFSMFTNIAPGGDSAVSGLVALLATASALADLSKVLQEKNVTKNVLFMLFNGEAFDYIGSSRVVYDMEHGKFPSNLDDNIVSQPPLISLHHIGHFIEFNQVGLVGAPKAVLWAHSDHLSSSQDPGVNSSIHELFDILVNESRNFPDIEVQMARATTSNFSLPPSSFQSFLKKDMKIPGLVLTDHQLKYTNDYYNSIFDGWRMRNLEAAEKMRSVDFIQTVATVTARTIYYLITNEENSTIAPEDGLVEELLDCYFNVGNCSLFKRISKESEREVLKSRATNLYIGVSVNGMRLMTSNLLASLLGELMPNYTASQCYAPANNSVYSYVWMPDYFGNDTTVNGACFKSTINTTAALSPAFIKNDFYSGLYSTWTESVWDGFSLRIFLKPSFQQEVVTLCIGILVLLISFSSVWFLERSSDVLFQCTNMMSGGC